jgi:hypothetical protein
LRRDVVRAYPLHLHGGLLFGMMDRHGSSSENSSSQISPTQTPFNQHSADADKGIPTSPDSEEPVKTSNFLPAIFFTDEPHRLQRNRPTPENAETECVGEDFAKPFIVPCLFEREKLWLIGEMPAL